MWLGIDTGYLQRSSRPQLCSEPPPPMVCTYTTLLAPWNGRPRCMHLALSGCITKCTIHLHAMHFSTTYSCSQLEHAPSIYIDMSCTPYRVTHTVVSRKYAPPFATLASVQNAGGGLYAGCDDFSRDFAPPSWYR